MGGFGVSLGFRHSAQVPGFSVSDFIVWGSCPFVKLSEPGPKD